MSNALKKTETTKDRPSIIKSQLTTEDAIQIWDAAVKNSIYLGSPESADLRLVLGLNSSESEDERYENILRILKRARREIPAKGEIDIPEYAAKLCIAINLKRLERLTARMR
jgi:hypothetical protein